MDLFHWQAPLPINNSFCFAIVFAGGVHFVHCGQQFVVKSSPDCGVVSL
jgi:hypothetical protein